MNVMTRPIAGEAANRGATGPGSAAVQSDGAPPLAPADPVIDLAHLSRMTLGERDLESDVLRLFDLQAGMLLARIASEPPKAIAGFAHTLCGSARGIGAWRVAEAAERIERLATSPGPTTLTAALNHLTAAVTEAQAAIAELLRAR